MEKYKLMFTTVVQKTILVRTPGLHIVCVCARAYFGDRALKSGAERTARCRPWPSLNIYHDTNHIDLHLRYVIFLNICSAIVD